MPNTAVVGRESYYHGPYFYARAILQRLAFQCANGTYAIGQRPEP